MHWLIVGETGTGKTTYAREVMAKRAVKQKKGLLIFDPFLDEWPKEAFVTPDRTKFLEEFWKRTDNLVIVEESGSAVRKNDEEMIETAILGRHRGHLIVYSCQRLQQVHPTIRGQCSHIIAFGCSVEDAEALAKRYDQPGFMHASTLPDGTYLYYHRKGVLSKGKIF